MDRAGVRAGPEDVGDQTLIRGLVPHFRLFVRGCPCLNAGIDLAIGHIVQAGIPLPWPRPRCCTIDVRWCSAVIGLLLRVRVEELWAGRALH